MPAEPEPRASAEPEPRASTESEPRVSAESEPRVSAESEPRVSAEPEPVDIVRAKMASLRKGVVVLALLALVLPAGCHFAIERQSTRLDALAEHGVDVPAIVTRVERSGILVYAYTVDGAVHEWSAAAQDVPLDANGKPPAKGSTIATLYLPENPSFDRAGTRMAARAAAADGRRIAWMVDLGLLWFFGFQAALFEVGFQRMLRTGRTERTDRVAYRRRLLLTAVGIAPFLALIFGFHASDAAARGESQVPVVVGAVLALAILGGTAWHVMRKGHDQVPMRASGLLGWALPLAAVVSGVRLVMWLLL